jgi:hypothetical protein
MICQAQGLFSNKKKHICIRRAFLFFRNGYGYSGFLPAFVLRPPLLGL